MVNQITFTETGKSYWSNNGAYQKEYNELYERLVPESGAAKTIHGELIRAISRLEYEYDNNGNCNACEVTMGEEETACCNCNGSGEFEDEGETDTCEDCGGSGVYIEEVVESVEVSRFYQKFLDLINSELAEKFPEIKALTDSIKCIIEAGYDITPSYYYSETNQNKYDKLSDYVIWYVLNTEDKELPSNYDAD